MIVEDVKESEVQQAIQNITAAGMKILMHIVKQWEALEWIIHQRQALNGVLREGISRKSHGGKFSAAKISDSTNL